MYYISWKIDTFITLWQNWEILHDYEVTRPYHKMAPKNIEFLKAAIVVLK